MSTIKTNKATRSCFCGCGAQTQSRFVPGHDARFHSLVKHTLREKLDVSLALETLPCEQSRAEFVAYAEKIAPKEAAREAALAEKVAAKAKKEQDKADAKALAAVVAVVADEVALVA